MWEQIYKETSDGKKDTLGDVYYEKFTEGLLKDIEEMDAEVIEALNDAVSVKKITFTARKDAEKKFAPGTYGLKFDDEHGVFIEYDPEYASSYPYPYQNYTISKYVLDNC